MPLLSTRKTSCPSHLTGRLLHRIATLILTACVPYLPIHPVKQAIAAEKPRVPNIVLILADDMGSILAPKWRRNIKEGCDENGS